MRRTHLLLMVAILGLLTRSGGNSPPIGSLGTGVPSDIQAVTKTPLYSHATWGLRVSDPSNGKVLIDLNSNVQFFIGSVRKIFSVGELLNQVGPLHAYNTPAYRAGQLSGSGA